MTIKHFVFLFNTPRPSRCNAGASKQDRPGEAGETNRWLIVDIKVSRGWEKVERGGNKGGSSGLARQVVLFLTGLHCPSFLSCMVASFYFDSVVFRVCVFLWVFFFFFFLFFLFFSFFFLLLVFLGGGRGRGRGARLCVCVCLVGGLFVVKTVKFLFVLFYFIYFE